MAINKTYFTGSTASANYAEVLAWMQENAADYFDEITGDESNIYCKIGNATALTLNFADSKLFTIALKNGVSVENYYGWSIKHFISAQKTNGGLFLFVDGTTNIFITKTNCGSIFFAGLRRVTSSNNSFYMCDFSNSTSITQSSTFSGTSGTLPSSSNSYGIYSASMTAITNVVSDGGTHCENLFLVPFTQYAGQSDVVIDIDGTKYVYNGIFALKE